VYKHGLFTRVLLIVSTDGVWLCCFDFPIQG